MGSANSKATPRSSQHIFASETPVRFSQELIDSLQASTESDSTREKTLELHIQNRVQQELRRIEAHESQLFKELEDKICSESSVTDRGGLQGGDGQAAGDKVRDLGRDSIQKEITSLKRRLDSRKKLENLDRDVEKAKSNVVDCLRTNDRRPLDCWKEVQVFRQEVGRLEQSFVDKALR